MIKTTDLWQRYNSIAAVKGLNLEISEGTTFGLVGPNGAGKTTTIRVLAGLLEPSAGTVEICGMNMSTSRRAIQRRIGYVPDDFGLYEDLKLWEYLDYFGHCYGLSRTERSERIDQLLVMARLSDKKDEFISALSRGMRQRLLVAKTLINNPDVLLLDEPTTGLDPKSRIELREILKELAATGRTMVIASNILYDVSSICDSLGIMNNGVLLESGTLHALSVKYKRERVVKICVVSGMEKIEDVLSRDSKVLGITIEGKVVRLRYEGDLNDMAELNGNLCQAGVKCTGLCEDKETIEDIFLKITN